MVNQISRIKIDRDIQILLQVTQNGKYLVLKIYEFNFKIKIYREEKKYHMTKQTKIGGGGAVFPLDTPLLSSKLDIKTSKF